MQENGIKIVKKFINIWRNNGKTCWIIESIWKWE